MQYIHITMFTYYLVFSNVVVVMMKADNHNIIVLNLIERIMLNILHYHTLFTQKQTRTYYKAIELYV